MSDFTKYGIWSLCVVLFQTVRAYSAIGKEGKAWTRRKPGASCGSFARNMESLRNNLQRSLAYQREPYPAGKPGATCRISDISLLSEIADYYDVGIPEIIAGERKSDGMNEEVKEVADAMSDYAGEEKAKLVKSIRNISIIGLIALIIYMVLGETGAYERNTLFRYAYGYSEVLIYVTVVMFPLYTTGLLSKLRIRNTGWGRIPGPALKVMAFIAAFAVAALIRIVLSKIF